MVPLAELKVEIQKKAGAFQLDLAFSTEDEVFALLGASGCGKSMTLQCIAGIVTPDQGRIVCGDKVFFDKEKKINLSPQKRKVGYLFQSYALFPNLSVRENMKVGMQTPKEEQRLEEMLERLELTAHQNHRPYQLSGGQQQRTALGRLLLSDPDVLLLDEPFSALDSYLKWQMEQLLLDVLAEFSGPILFVSHDRDEVYRLSDRIGVMTDGRLSSVDEKKELFYHPKTLASAQLSGCKNFSQVEIKGQRVFAKDWGVTFTLEGDIPEGTQQVGIRGHYFSLAPKERQKTGHQIPCRITRMIENTFSYIVVAEPINASKDGNKAYQTLRWEVTPKNRMPKLSIGDEILLTFQEHNLFLLGETPS